MRRIIERIAKLSLPKRQEGFGPFCWCKPGGLPMALLGGQDGVDKVSGNVGYLRSFRRILLKNCSLSPSSTILRFALSTIGLLTLTGILHSQEDFYSAPDGIRSKFLQDLDSQLIQTESILFQQPDKAYTQMQDLLSLVHQQEAKREEGFAYFFSALTFMTKGMWREAEELFFESIDAFRLAGDTLGVALASDKVGYAFREQGRMDQSLKYHLQGLRLREDYKDQPIKIAYSNASVGGVYFVLKDYDTALKYFDKAFAIRQAEGDTLGIGLSLKGIGRLHRLQKRFDEGLDCLLKALDIFQKVQGMGHIIDTYEELGYLYRSIALPEQAKRSFLKGLEVGKEMNSIGKMARIHLELGLLYKEEEELQLARENLEASLTNSLRSESQSNTIRAYEELSLIAEESGDFEQAHEFYKAYTRAKDSLYSQNYSQQLAQIKTVYETEQKEQEIENLKQETAWRLRERRVYIAGVIVLMILALALIGAFRQRNLAYSRTLMEQEKTQSLLQEKEALLQDLKSAQGHLVQSEKMASLGQLTAGIAHEINNPINFMASNVHALKLDFDDLKKLLAKVKALSNQPNTPELLNDIVALNQQLDINYLEDEISQLIEGIERGASRTQNIVIGLRTFSRRSGEEFVPADLHRGLDATLTILNNKISPNAKIIKDYGNIPLVACQFDRINQVFMNVLNNAIDAIGKTGTIKIKTWADRKSVFIAIQDDGPGMSQETIERIFEPFFTTKEVGKGTGLGLSISYGIIQQHGGKISAESELGKGAQFTIQIPTEQHDQTEASST